MMMRIIVYDVILQRRNGKDHFVPFVIAYTSLKSVFTMEK